MRRIGSLVAAALMLGPGCTAFKGQPNINGSVWLFAGSNSSANTSPPAGNNPSYSPPVCPKGDSEPALRPFVNQTPGESNTGSENIRLCVDALKQLVDLRWAAYADSLQTLDSGGNTLADTVKLGLTGAATAAVGPTAQVLSGIATFIGGVQTTVNQDVLYSKTLQLIILQMQKDRATWADTIQKQLAANSYANMYEAANDLFQYARAGSWNNALTTMQADSGAQTAACTTQVQTTKKDEAARAAAPKGMSVKGVASTAAPASTATSPCPPASLTTPDTNQLGQQQKNGSN